MGSFDISENRVCPTQRKVDIPLTYASMFKDFFLLLISGILFQSEVMASSSPNATGQVGGATQERVLAWLNIEGTTQPVTYREVLHEQVERASFPPDDASPEVKESHFGRMIRLAALRKVLVSQAFHQGLDQLPKIHEKVSAKRLELLVKTLQEKVTSVIPVPTDEEVATYYQNHIDQFTLPETFYVQIVNSYCQSPEDPSQLELARQHAEKAQAEIEAGSDFAAVAVKYSNSPIPYRGETIAFSPGELNPVLEDAARQLRNGERSGLLRGRYGYMIIRRMGYTPAVPRSLEQVRGGVNSHIHHMLQDQKWEEYKRASFQAMKPKIHLEALQKETISPDTPLLEFNNRRVSFSEIEARYPDLVKTAMSSSVEKKRAVFDKIMETELIYEKAKTEGISELPSVKKELDGFMRDLLFHEREHQLLDEMRENMVDSKEVEAFFSNNKQRLRTQKETRIEILNIPVEREEGDKGDSPSEKAMARALWLALEARNRILAGESFELLSNRYSGKGWDWERDFQPQGPRGRIIDMAVETLDQGELSQPVEHSQGYYLIRLMEIHEPRPLTLDEARTQIEETLRNRKAREKLEARYQMLLVDHQFKVNTEYLYVE